ncbi:MAG: hypothetical protein GC186_00740 [Rhodobacteraceae bacterium]|nr:hypothetical protein [Paracoccaceae bacterium]
MLALKIFVHSIRQVTGNLEAALRLSVVPMLIQFGAFLLLDGSVSLFPTTATPYMAVIGLIAAALVVQGLIGCWIAVGWHRFVLLGERPTGVLPTLRRGRMLDYIGRGLILILLLISLGIGLAIPVLLITEALQAVLPNFPILTSLLPSVGIALVLGVAIQRLSMMLPAAALGKELGPGMALEATKGQAGTLVVLAILSTLFASVAMAPAALLGYLGLGTLQIVWKAAARIALTLLFLSVLTTLYGYLVEKRALA